MGDIARGRQRFVAGCTRCLRTALASIPTKYDDDGRDETSRNRRALRRRDAAPASPAVARALLAGSMAVAGSSRRLRDALASIPLADEDDVAEQALRTRLAMASPAVAGALLAGVVTASPAQAQPSPQPPPPTAPAPAPAQSPAPPAPAPPPEPPLVTEYATGMGWMTPWGPLGGEVGMLVHPDGRIQLTGLGGWYAGGKISGERRSARTPGFAFEGKAVGSVDNVASGEVVAQLNLNEAARGNFPFGDSWKLQHPWGPYVGGTFSGSELDVDPRYGLQHRLQSDAKPFARELLGAAGLRVTTEPMTQQQLNDMYNPNLSPMDPATFRNRPAPTQPYWEAFAEDVSQFVGDTFTGTPPADPAWIEGSQIDQPPPPDWGQVLAGLQQLSTDAQAYGAGAGGAVPLQPGDSAALLESWQQWLQGLLGQSAAPAPVPGVAPAPGVVAPPGIVPPGGLVPLPGVAPAAPGVAPVGPGMTWDQMLQSWMDALNGPVLVDPGWFQDQTASAMEGTAPDPDGEDAPAFEMSEAESDDADEFEADDDSGESEDDTSESDDDSEDSESDDDSEDSESDDDSEDSESDDDSEDSESDDDSEDSESDDDSDEFESEDDSAEFESEDDGGESEDDSEDSESDEDDGGESNDDGDEWESEDDGGGDESESDDDGSEEAESESDGGGGDESDGGGDESESDGGGGGESDGGGGGGDSAGEGGAPDAQAPADPPDAGSEGGGEEPRGDGYDYGDFDEGPGVEQDVGGGDISPEQAA